jgi:type I site-specific restriction-modification system R (restriction) subunit
VLCVVSPKIPGEEAFVCGVDLVVLAEQLMQAIARANRVYPGKDFGLIVDYNGMLKSLREALAQYALGDDGSGGEEIVAPIEERVQARLPARNCAWMRFSTAALPSER